MKHIILRIGAVLALALASVPPALARQEVVIGIGTHFNDLNTAGWSFYDFGGRQSLIHIDIDPGEIGRVYPTAVGLVADAREALTSLLAAWRTSGRRRDGATDWLAKIAGWRREWRAESQSLDTSDVAPLRCARIVAETLSPLMKCGFAKATSTCHSGLRYDATANPDS